MSAAPTSVPTETELLIADPHAWWRAANNLVAQQLNLLETPLLTSVMRGTMSRSTKSLRRAP